MTSQTNHYYIYIYIVYGIYYMNPYNGPIQKYNSSMGLLLRMFQCLRLVNSNLIRCYVCYSVYDWSIQIWWGVTYATVFMIGHSNIMRMLQIHNAILWGAEFEFLNWSIVLLYFVCPEMYISSILNVSFERKMYQNWALIDSKLQQRICIIFLIKCGN